MLHKRVDAKDARSSCAFGATQVEETAAETTSPTPPSPAAARRTAVSEGAEWRRAVRSLRGWGELPLARISKDLFSISVPPPQMTRYAHQQNVLTSEMRPIELALGASQSHALIALLVDPDFGLDDLRRVHEAVASVRRVRFLSFPLKIRKETQTPRPGSSPPPFSPPHAVFAIGRLHS